MSDRPNAYLDNPDPLSSALSSLRLSAQVYANDDYCGQWAVDTSGSRRMPFHLIGRGEAWLHVNGRSPERLSAGDLVIFPRDTPHVIAHSSTPPAPSLINADSRGTSNDSTATNMACGFFDFYGQAGCSLAESLPPVIVMIDSNNTSAPVIRSLVGLLIGELAKQSPGFYSVINHLAYLLFIEIIRHQMLSGEIKNGPLIALFDHKIGKALAAIHNAPGRRWTLESLAKEAIMGRSSFAKRFSDLTGSSPMQYLANWRMQEAVQLIGDKNLSIASIAGRCGYDSDVAFRKAFKKLTGQTPGEMRRQIIGSATQEYSN